MFQAVIFGKYAIHALKGLEGLVLENWTAIFSTKKIGLC